MRYIIVALILASAGVAEAQNAPAPQVLPDLDHFSLAPSGPQPTPTATPEAAPLPAAAIPAAAPTPEPTPRAIRSPTPRATPAPTAPEPAVVTPPVATPSPTPPAALQQPPAAVPAPVASPAPSPAPVAASAPSGLPWAWITLAAVMVLAAVAWATLRRRTPVAPAVPRDAVRGPAAAPTAPAPVPAPATDTPGDRPWLEIAFRPRRAGTNLLSAAVDYQLTLTNRGKGSARDIRIACELLSASATQDAEIVALYDDTIDLPVVPPFALAPGETRMLDGFATRPRDRLEVIQIQGRPMFVPIVAIRAGYRYDAESAGLATASYVVGIERLEGGARMGPIWLDQPPKMRSDVGARPYVAGRAGVGRIGSPETV